MAEYHIQTKKKENKKWQHHNKFYDFNNLDDRVIFGKVGIVFNFNKE